MQRRSITRESAYQSKICRVAHDRKTRYVEVAFARHIPRVSLPIQKLCKGPGGRACCVDRNRNGIVFPASKLFTSVNGGARWQWC
jgi:hypothetical protein